MKKSSKETRIKRRIRTALNTTVGFLSIFLLSTQSWAAPAVVQCMAAQQVSGANSGAASFGVLPSVNNHIIVMYATQTGNSPPELSSVTDNQSNSYNIDVQKTNISAQYVVAALASAIAATSSGTFTVTVHFGGTLSGVWKACEVSGLATASWLDQTGTTEGTSTTTAIATASGANSQASEIVFALVSNNSANSTPTTGYTEQDKDQTFKFEFAYKVVAGLETSSATWTYASSAQMAAVIATYKATASGGAAIKKCALLGVC